MTRDRLTVIGYGLVIITAVILLALARPIIGWMVDRRWLIVTAAVAFVVFCVVEAIAQEARK